MKQERPEILKMLEGYAASRPLRMHMPGHKADKRFLALFSKAASLDITELAFSDNLENPEGVIRAAEDRAARLSGAERVFFLTDGSTSGVLSMLLAVRDRGNKILINRNAHKSVYHACMLMGIEPVVLRQNVMRGVFLPPAAEEIERALGAYDGVIGAFLTYPDYYGNAFDLAKIKGILAAKGKLLLLDGAHGAHFNFDEELVYAGKYADLWVDGLHKTLPALTQAAALCVGNPALLPAAARAANVFRTSSPNYLILASIEYAYRYMEEEGAAKLKLLRQELVLMRQRLRVRGAEFYPSADPMKLLLDCKQTGIDPYRAEKILADKGVYVEMNDGRYLLFLLSPVMTVKKLRALERAAGRVARMKKLRGTYVDRPDAGLGKKRLPYLVAVESEGEYVPLEAAEGRIAAASAGLFPPCFPLVVAGETVTREAADCLLAAAGTFGIEEGKIYCVK